MFSVCLSSCLNTVEQRLKVTIPWPHSPSVHRHPDLTFTPNITPTPQHSPVHSHTNSVYRLHWPHDHPLIVQLASDSPHDLHITPDSTLRDRRAAWGFRWKATVIFLSAGDYNPFPDSGQLITLLEWIWNKEERKTSPLIFERRKIVTHVHYSFSKSKVLQWGFVSQKWKYIHFNMK